MLWEIHAILRIYNPTTIPNRLTIIIVNEMIDRPIYNVSLVRFVLFRFLADPLYFNECSLTYAANTRVGGNEIWKKCRISISYIFAPTNEGTVLVEKLCNRDNSMVKGKIEEVDKIYSLRYIWCNRCFYRVTQQSYLRHF